jgi:hypothetical protein
MTFWCIYRSPLMLGGNLPDNRELEERLFTNEEVLRVNQEGAAPRQLYKQGGGMVWVSDAEDGGKYIGIFNISDEKKSISVSFSQLGWKGPVRVRDLWAKKDTGIFRKIYSRMLPPHGAALLHFMKETR